VLPTGSTGAFPFEILSTRNESCARTIRDIPPPLVGLDSYSLRVRTRTATQPLVFVYADICQCLFSRRYQGCPTALPRDKFLRMLNAFVSIKMSLFLKDMKADAPMQLLGLVALQLAANSEVM